MPDPSLVDGVTTRPATATDLATVQVACQQLDGFSVPQLYDSSDPHARVYLMLMDGTGNDAINDPQHTTNIGILKDQLTAIRDNNLAIGFDYIPGPGTQGGLFGALDAATGATYGDRVQQGYELFARQSKIWIQEDPNVKISVIEVGFSRGAEEAAGFSVMVHSLGIQDVATKTVIRTLNESSGQYDEQITYTGPALRLPGSIAQAMGLYDPVGTGAPSTSDRQPKASVLSGFQINAGDERRLQFPSTSIIDQNSTDPRFLGVTVAASHSDVGGGYLLNGLSAKSFNLMAKYLNGLLGEQAITKLDEPTDPAMTAIHNSDEHLFLYIRLQERNTIYQLNPGGAQDAQPVDASLAGQFQYSTIGGANSPGIPHPTEQAGAVENSFTLITRTTDELLTQAMVETEGQTISPVTEGTVLGGPTAAEQVTYNDPIRLSTPGPEETAAAVAVSAPADRLVLDRNGDSMINNSAERLSEYDNGAQETRLDPNVSSDSGSFDFEPDGDRASLLRVTGQGLPGGVLSLLTVAVDQRLSGALNDSGTSANQFAREAVSRGDTSATGSVNMSLASGASFPIGSIEGEDGLAGPGADDFVMGATSLSGSDAPSNESLAIVARTLGKNPFGDAGGLVVDDLILNGTDGIGARLYQSAFTDEERSVVESLLEQRQDEGALGVHLDSSGLNAFLPSTQELAGQGMAAPVEPEGIVTSMAAAEGTAGIRVVPTVLDQPDLGVTPPPLSLVPETGQVWPDHRTAAPSGLAQVLPDGPAGPAAWLINPIFSRPLMPDDPFSQIFGPDPWAFDPVFVEPAPPQASPEAQPATEVPPPPPVPAAPPNEPSIPPPVEDFSFPDGWLDPWSVDPWVDPWSPDPWAWIEPPLPAYVPPPVVYEPLQTSYDPPSFSYDFSYDSAFDYSLDLPGSIDPLVNDLDGNGFDLVGLWDSVYEPPSFFDDFFYDFSYDFSFDFSYGIDPLVIDLDGNGFDLVGLRDSSILYDMDADGVVERTGWVKPTDGLLVLDRNGNGAIDDITEIFSEKFAPPATTGLKSLATLDAKGEGSFDATDPAFASVQVWRDLNQNGQTDGGELAGLAALGITSIALDGRPAHRLDEGNTIVTDTTARRTDGSTLPVADISLRVEGAAGTNGEVGERGVAHPFLDTQVDQLRQAMASFGTPALSADMALSSDIQHQLAPALAAAWEGKHDHS
jgi:hypothetical protein